MTNLFPELDPKPLKPWQGGKPLTMKSMQEGFERAMADTDQRPNVCPCGPNEHRTLAEAMRFDGDTFDEQQDGERLSGLLARVRAAMGDGGWWTLRQLQEECGGTEASISARIRDLRKDKFGGADVARRRVDAGLWEYRLGGDR